jgi:hypothetical protein
MLFFLQKVGRRLKDVKKEKNVAAILNGPPAILRTSVFTTSQVVAARGR